MSLKIINIPFFEKGDALLPQLLFIVDDMLRIIEKEEGPCTFEINFQKNEFYSCFLLGLMHSLIQQFKSKNKIIHITGFNKVRNYLEAIHFDDFCLLDVDELVKYEHKSYLPILHFPCVEKLITPYINALLTLIYDKTSADYELRNDISFIISEITDNILEHSESKNGMVYAQYYANTKTLDIFVSDSGQGVFNSYSRNENFNPATNEEALKFALEGKSSKYDGTDTRGYGLEESRQRILNRNGLIGRFIMWSGNTVYIEKGKDNWMVDLDDLKYAGCAVFIRLSC